VSVAEDNVTIVVDAPFDPPLGPSDILSITSYRGHYTVEGNRFRNGTCFAYYGGVLDSIVSGNTFDEMFQSNWVQVPGWSLASPTIAPGVGGGGLVGGGGRVYATSLQNELYNLCSWVEGKERETRPSPPPPLTPYHPPTHHPLTHPSSSRGAQHHALCILVQDHNGQP
jgi:hypothetical protein